MTVHRSVRTTPWSRAQLIARVQREGWTVKRAAHAYGISTRTAYKWLARYRDGGEAALTDRPSVPHRIPHRTRPRRVLEIVALRAQRLPGHVIARRVGVPRSTVSRVLRRVGLARLAPPTAPVMVRRYERGRPGALPRGRGAAEALGSGPACGTCSACDLCPRGPRVNNLLRLHA